MPLTSLGTQSVNFGDGWVLYNPINLNNARVYLVEIDMTTSDESAVLSKFVVRAAFPSQNTNLVADITQYTFYYESVRQGFDLRISPNLVGSGNLRLAVRRFPFYSRPATLSNVDVTLGIDDSIWYPAQ